MNTSSLVLLVVLIVTILSARTLTFQITLVSDERGDEQSNWVPQQASIYSENVSSSFIADNVGSPSTLRESNHEVSIESPLNDKTLMWDSSVDRVWMRTNQHVERPPAVLTLTNLYWNHRNQPYRGLKNFRTKRTRELIEGVINHPWFDPTVWEELVQKGGSSRWKNDTSTRIYVFFDYDTVRTFSASSLDCV